MDIEISDMQMYAQRAFVFFSVVLWSSASFSCASTQAFVFDAVSNALWEQTPPSFHKTAGKHMPNALFMYDIVHWLLSIAEVSVRKRDAVVFYFKWI